MGFLSRLEDRPWYARVGWPRVCRESMRLQADPNVFGKGSRGEFPPRFRKVVSMQVESWLPGSGVGVPWFRPAMVMALALALLAGWHGRAADATAPGGSGKDLKVGSLRVGKVLILGNSVTRHGPAPEIGWTGDWGMAASAKEKDFAHRLVDLIAKEAGGTPELKVKNIADFERRQTDYDVAKELKDELAFEADVVIVAIGANAPNPATDEAKARYRSACKGLLAEVKKHGHPVLFVRSEFWDEPVKEAIMKPECLDAGGVYVDIGAPAKDGANAARSERKIDHDGVAGHPGDRGMQVIADALWAAIRKRGAGN